MSSKKKINKTLFRKLPKEIIYHNIIAFFPIDWLLIDKLSNKIASKISLDDPRIKLGDWINLAPRAKLRKPRENIFIFDYYALYLRAIKSKNKELFDQILRKSGNSAKGQILKGFSGTDEMTIYAAKKFLEDHDVDPNGDIPDVLLWILEENLIDVFEILSHNGNYHPSTDNALSIAISWGRNEIAKLILADPRCKVSQNDNSALRSAIENNETEIAELIRSDYRYIENPIEKEYSSEDPYEYSNEAPDEIDLEEEFRKTGIY